MRGAGSYIGIRTLYFDFKPASAHAPSCPLAGTNTWEVTRCRRTGLNGELLDTVFRFACHQCGAVTFESTEGPISFEATGAEQIGYASKPVKVAGLWMWPGPRLYIDDRRGPTAYFITRTADRPRQPADVAAAVAWHEGGPRGGIRWTAGIGLNPAGQVIRRSEEDFPSRGAAVAWVAGQLDGASGPGEG